MKQLERFIQLIKSNWVLGLTHRFVIGLLLLSLFFFIFKLRSLPPQVPLWFSRPWGQDQLASPYWLLLLPLTSLFVYIINAVISLYVTSEYLVFTQLLFISSLIVNILSFVALIKILFLIA